LLKAFEQPRNQLKERPRMDMLKMAGSF